MTDHEKKIGNRNLARNDGYPHRNYFGLSGVAAGVAPLVVTDGRPALVRDGLALPLDWTGPWGDNSDGGRKTNL